MKRTAQECLAWFGLSRLNYISACRISEWLAVDNALRQKKQNLRAMAKNIVGYDRALMRAEGYRP